MTPELVWRWLEARRVGPARARIRADGAEMVEVGRADRARRGRGPTGRGSHGRGGNPRRTRRPHPAKPGELWGVWAAESPEAVVTVTEEGDGDTAVLDGTKAVVFRCGTVHPRIDHRAPRRQGARPVRRRSQSAAGDSVDPQLAQRRHARQRHPLGSAVRRVGGARRPPQRIPRPARILARCDGRGGLLAGRRAWRGRSAVPGRRRRAQQRVGRRARPCPPRRDRRRARGGRSRAHLGRLLRRRRTARRPRRADRPPGPRRGRARRRRGDHAHRARARDPNRSPSTASTPNASPTSRSMSARATPSATSPPWGGSRRGEVGALRQRVPIRRPADRYRRHVDRRSGRAGGATFPELNLDDCPALVLVAPHPDDETLGFGATASTLRSRGIDVQVVSVTDGGGAFPELSRREREWLESDRRAELHRAIEILGLGAPIHLGLPDGELSDHESRVGRPTRRAARGRAEGYVVRGDVAGRRASRPRSGRARGRRGCRTYRGGAAGVSDVDVALGRPGR